MKISGWGRTPMIEANVSEPRDLSQLKEHIFNKNMIARGNGRSYGDSAVNINNTVHMKHFNKMLEFNSESGLLTVEAGVLLADIIQCFLPRGWFPSVTPGTKFVTIGGLIAADVHGKNHHKQGSFRSCVDWIEVLTASGKVERCSRQENSELFNFTVGGMGLTGVIIKAAIRLQRVSSPLIKQRTIVTKNLSHTLDVFTKYSDATYSVAWIDCLKRGEGRGRALVMLGEHYSVSESSRLKKIGQIQIKKRYKITIPFNFPSWFMNNFFITCFNNLYYIMGRLKRKDVLVDWDKFFYPLDSILNWNKIYGRKGFVQFQCVLPLSTSKKALELILDKTSQSALGSFLAVLKRFGPDESFVSFPEEGYTLAMDFPSKQRTLKLLEELDAITIAHGGRFYLAKDSRLTSKVFRNSDPRFINLSTYRKQIDALDTFRSCQSERLGL